MINDGQVKCFISHVSCEKSYSIALHSSVWFLQLVVHRCPNKAQMLYKTSVTTALETKVHFHRVAFTSREVVEKKGKMSQNLVDSLLTGIFIQVM